jgi:hypothetical protein
MSIGIVRPCRSELVAPFVLGGIRELLNRTILHDRLPEIDRRLLATEIVRIAKEGLMVNDA